MNKRIQTAFYDCKKRYDPSKGASGGAESKRVTTPRQ